MNVTIDQAIEITARMFKHRWKTEASQRARVISDELRRTGDLEGAAIYIEVAQRADEVTPLSEQNPS